MYYSDENYITVLRKAVVCSDRYLMYFNILIVASNMISFVQLQSV